MNHLWVVIVHQVAALLVGTGLGYLAHKGYIKEPFSLGLVAFAGIVLATSLFYFLARYT